MGSPARGYRWADATPGNDLALKHGAYSERRVEPIAVELAAGITTVRPDLAEPRFVFAVRAWARAEARVANVEDWLVDRGLLGDDGDPRPATELLLKLERQAADLRARLGLDPRSDAQLSRERTDATRSAVDLDAVRQAGRQAIEARESDG